MSKNIKNAFVWFFSIFCFMGVLVYFPSFASVLMLGVAVGSLPVKSVRKFWRKVPVAPKLVKTMTLTVLFFTAVSCAPVTETNTNTETTQVVENALVTDVEDGNLETDKDITSNTTPVETSKVQGENTEQQSETATGTSETTTDDSSLQTKQPMESNVSTKPEESIEVEGFDIKSIPAYSGNPYVVVNNNVPFFEAKDLTTESYEYYSDLDGMGRCGVCVASISTDIMPTEEYGKIGSVKPTGWNQAKYPGLVDGNYLYNRCHLIGHQLTGEDANTKNLITGTRYFNVEGMLPFENMVADYVKETRNHVMYRISPIFEGNNLVASGVLMEAKSVEDDGEGILFCVFCYNVQPGVIIDYSNGASSLAEGATLTNDEGANSNEDKTQDSYSEPAPTPETIPAPAPQESKEDGPAGGFAVNGNNGKIHMVGACQATGNGRNAMNNPVYFNTYDEALAYSIQISPGEDKRDCGNCW